MKTDMRWQQRFHSFKKAPPKLLVIFYFNSLRQDWKKNIKKFSNNSNNVRLKPQYYQRNSARFSQKNFVEEAILYGSRAKGNYRKGSDIDFVVAGKNLSTDSIFLLEEQLEALGFLYKFDVQHTATLNNASLLKHIREEGKLFYKKDNEGQRNEG